MKPTESKVLSSLKVGSHVNSTNCLLLCLQDQTKPHAGLHSTSFVPGTSHRQFLIPSVYIASDKYWQWQRPGNECICDSNSLTSNSAS